MSDRGKPADQPPALYGPHPQGIDESSGGADSSPFENLLNGEKAIAAEKDKKAGGRERTPAAGNDPAR
jgi:hypothetical protein